MQISLDDIPRDVPVIGQYLSGLPSDADMSAAWSTDPWVTQLYSEEGWVRLLGFDVKTLVRGIIARVATSTIGLATELVRPMMSVVRDDIMAPIRDLIEGAVLDVVDDVMDTLGSVPIVGWIIDLAVSVLKLLVSIMQAGLGARELLPLATFSKELNDGRASEALANFVGNPADLRGRDWMKIFRPPFVARKWERHNQENGVLWSPVAADSESFEGLGFLEGSPMEAVTGVHVSWVRQFRTGGDYWRYTLPWDQSNLYPSVGHIATSVMGLAKSRTSQVFQFNCGGNSGWQSEWKAYLEPLHEAIGEGQTANQLARQISQASRAGNQDPERMHRMAIKHLALSFVESRLWNAALATGRAIRTRQLEALQTNLAATCSQDQPAFQDEQLRADLRAARVRILTHPYVRLLNPNDIPDADFRTEVERTQRDVSDEVRDGGYKLIPGDGIRPVDSIPPAKPFPKPGEGLGSGAVASLGPVVPALALAVAGGLFWRWRSRSSAV